MSSSSATRLQDQLAASPASRSPPEVLDGEDWEMVFEDDVAGLPALSWPTRPPLIEISVSYHYNQYQGPTAPPGPKRLPSRKEGKFDWQTQSILFRLPDTLREQIYKEVLVLGTPKVRLKQTQRGREGGHSASVLAVLATCRRIACEAEHLFYKFNHFLLTGDELTGGFLRGLRAERRDALKRVTISVSSGAGALGMLKELQLAPNIEYLDIERRIPVRYTNVREWAVMAKQLKGEIGNFKRLRKIGIVYSEGNSPSPEELEGAPRLQSIDSMLTEDVRDRGSELKE